MAPGRQPHLGEPLRRGSPLGGQQQPRRTPRAPAAPRSLLQPRRARAAPKVPSGSALYPCAASLRMAKRVQC